MSLDELWLWTGESVFCRCTHHVEDHCTNCYNYIRLFHCHKCNECTRFKPHKIRPGTYLETEPLEIAI